MKEAESTEMASLVTEEEEAKSFEMTRLAAAKLDREEVGRERGEDADRRSLLPRAVGAPVPPPPTDWYGHLGKAVFLATGVYWGVSMQLMVYAGAARYPLALLPNLTWYISMFGALLPGRLVACRCADGALTMRFGRRPPSPGRARGAPRLFPRWDPLWRNGPLVVASVCDWLGTVGLTVGLTLSGSAIFGIVFSSVSIWAALFARCVRLEPSGPDPGLVFHKFPRSFGRVLVISIPRLRAAIDAAPMRSVPLLFVISVGCCSAACSLAPSWRA